MSKEAICIKRQKQSEIAANPAKVRHHALRVVRGGGIEHRSAGDHKHCRHQRKRRHIRSEERSRQQANPTTPTTTAPGSAWDE